MSKERAISKPAPEAQKKQETAPRPKGDMTSEQAATMILAPYVTEKTFNQIEKENKLAFIVAEKATKKQIIDAINILYEADVEEVNTTRTIRGKKAFVKFKTPEGARDLATRLALV
ncbi:MAG TPA: 50S ribosomal protein L23 [Nitrososphaera sp.]|jgi:large subunit ribosomal protein L23|nr:50S ribosomal protein L23 [Nitrososphaera sp.]